jgi:predicted kinase
MRVYILCGLPGSGKSTWARNKSRTDGGLIINRDSLRTMFYGSYEFIKDLEFIIRDVAISIISQLLDFDEKDIIIDECNLTSLKRSFWVQTIKSKFNLNPNTKIIIVYFNETERNVELREKDDLRGYTSEYWSKVISDMKKIFEKPAESEEVDEIMEVSI